MRTPILAAILAALFPMSSQARLGETEAQLIERFGKPTRRAVQKHIAQSQILDLCPQLIFRHDDWTIVVNMVNGRSLQEHYSKKGEWTEEQFKAVLDANRQGANWSDFSKESTRKLVREWRRTDGAISKWQSIRSQMVVTHSDYEKAKQALEAKAKAKASKVPKF